MKWPPERRLLLPPAKALVIDWFFGDSGMAGVLGGSCALSEFYLGHRRPNDIDLFMPGRNAAREAAARIATYFRGSHQPHASRPHTQVVSLGAGAESTEVHCCPLHERFGDQELRDRYVTSCSPVVLQTLPFLGFCKLVSMQSSDTGEDRATSLYDLSCLALAGIDAAVIAGEVLWMALRAKTDSQLPGIRLSDVVAQLPEKVAVDGVLHDLSAFATQFCVGISRAWNETGLARLLEDVA